MANNFSDLDSKPDDPDFIEMKRIVAESGARVRTDKWRPKLTFTQQCAVYAMRWNFPEVPISALATYFNIKKSTIGYMCRIGSPHYKRVRLRADELGKTDFRREYLTKELVEAIIAVVNKEAPVMLDGPNINHDKYKGEHDTKNGGFRVWWDTRPDNEGVNKTGWFVYNGHDALGPSGPFDTSVAAYNEGKDWF